MFLSLKTEFITMEKVVVIGSGNVASCLAIELKGIGFTIQQIYSRTISNAQFLANKVSAQAINKISEITPNADFYLVAISDDAIPQLVEQIYFEPRLIVHTAGSVHLNVLSKFKNRGVFYPLQTFTKGRDVSFKNIPICIEASLNSVLKQLISIAQKCSNDVRELSSEQRKQCHLAAVVANNFTNHFYVLAEKLLSEKGLPFDILKPLILETAQKVQDISPFKAQTGPAVRNNQKVINSHMQQLSDGEMEKLYSFVSESIINLHKTK